MEFKRAKIIACEPKPNYRIYLSFGFISLRIKDLFAIFCIIFLTNSACGYWFRQILQNLIENLS